MSSGIGGTGLVTVVVDENYMCPGQRPGYPYVVPQPSEIISDIIWQSELLCYDMIGKPLMMKSRSRDSFGRIHPVYTYVIQDVL